MFARMKTCKDLWNVTGDADADISAGNAAAPAGALMNSAKMRPCMYSKGFDTQMGHSNRIATQSKHPSVIKHHLFLSAH